MGFQVIRNDSDELKLHCERDHYLHRFPDPRSLPFGYVISIPNHGETNLVQDELHAKDGRLWGFVVMKKPQHHRQTGLFGYPGLPTSWQVLDLARVWIHPFLQNPFMQPSILNFKLEKTYYIERGSGYARSHNAHVFSQLVSKVLACVQMDWREHHPPVFPEQPYDIRLIISYCELAHHDGGAYKASSFKSCGKTSDGTKEVYVRWLKSPRKAWQPTHAIQMPLLGDVPAITGKAVR
jgi:hypothetical protein